MVDVALRTCDKRVAEKRLAEMVRQAEYELEGITPPKGLVQGAQRRLLDHLADFVADLRAKGRNRTYSRNVDQRMRILMRECGWEYPKDVTADKFREWREKQSKAPKTLNEYRAVVSSLFSWMKDMGRVSENPMEGVKPVVTRGRETFERRALSTNEQRALLDVAGPRQVVYLTALRTGLRRKELDQLRWHNVCLDGPESYVEVRAAVAKNRRVRRVPLCEEGQVPFLL